MRAVSWTPWFNELYVYIKNLGQTNRQTDTTVYRVAPQIKMRKRLLTGTLPVNKSLLTGTVTVNKFLLTGIIVVNNFLLTGTVLVHNFLLTGTIRVNNPIERSCSTKWFPIDLSYHEFNSAITWLYARVLSCNYVSIYKYSNNEVCKYQYILVCKFANIFFFK